MANVDEVKIGDILSDNDPRQPGRRLTVVGNNGVKAHARCGNRVVKIDLGRIYTDGKPRRTGFSLVRSDVETR